MNLTLGTHDLDLSGPVVMGIVNVTPDSFSDGGRHLDPGDAIATALEMAEEGASIIDIGGESTRPGAQPVPADVQLARVLPVLEGLRGRLDVPISVDTGDAAVIHEVTAAGAALINDVFALRQPGALDAAASSGAAVCLMHMQGTPLTMQDSPSYSQLPGDLLRFFAARIEACNDAGIERQRLLLDPGFGFGKRDAHNLRLLATLPEIGALGLPVLVGLSRKATLGRLIDRPVEQRQAAGVAAAVLAVERGAHIVRTHDVPATVDALKIVRAVRSSDGFEGDASNAKSDD